MTAMPPYLPLSEGLTILLLALRDGPVTWSTPQVVARARTFGLVTGTASNATLTTTGRVVAEVIDSHGYSTGYAHPGKIGVKGRCRCRDWEWSTNEGGADGRRRVRNAHAAHLAALINERLGA